MYTNIWAHICALSHLDIYGNIYYTIAIERERKLAYGCGIPLGDTYRIPPFLNPSAREKSLAPGACRLYQRFLRFCLCGKHPQSK